MIALAVALGLLAFALRLPGLEQSMFGDELFTVHEVIGRGYTEMLGAIHDSPEVTPPLYFTLAWLSTKVFSGLDALRVPSLVLSTATVPLALALGRRMAGTAAGALGALLLALSPFAIFYAAEARPYATVGFLACLSTLALIRALDTRRLAWWAIYTLAVAAAIYAHYTTIFVVGAQALWAAYRLTDRWREIAGATVAAAILYVPWVPSIGDKHQLAIYGGVDLGILPRALAQAFPGQPFALPRLLPGAPALLILAAVVAIGALVSLVGWRASGRSRLHLGPGVALLALLAVATPAGLVLYSLVSGDNLLLPRNFSASLPAATLLVGAILTAPPPRVAAPLALAATAAVGVGTIKGFGESYRRPATKLAARLIDGRGADDPVLDLQYVAAGNPTSRALRLYLPRSHRVFVREQREAAWAEAARLGTPLFVAWTEAAAFGSLAPFGTPPPRYVGRFRLVMRKRYPGIFPVYVREYAPLPPRRRDARPAPVTRGLAPPPLR